VRRWLRRAYPAIAARAEAEDGAVFWGDETGLRSDDVRGRSSAPRGRAPLVRVCHKRVGLSLLSAVSNRGELRWGELRWMVLEGAVKAPALIRFSQRPIQDARRKVFLILDRLPAHRARRTSDRLAAHRAEIEVFHLPSYGPDLNPDEGVHADLKRAVTREAPARGKPQLKRAVISHMRSSATLPKRIRSIFRHQQFRHAA
jgi:transposase